ncbi:MAG: hypothetical protein ABS95_01155 [Verrucomicrobia bacterium SCN 57-15]|nr:MAG: hypothetical protein ABS95_01155 [Verrucomicrobia bacterium SCN 57-15]
MTPRQQKALYFPAWRIAAANHGWTSSRPVRVPRVAVFGGPEVNDLYQRIWTIAQEKAGPLTAPNADHFRRACHVIAIGQDKSSCDLTNAELDRVLALFKLLADPDDLAALMSWNNPDEERRKRILWWLKKECVESYVVEVCRQKFQTANWEALSFKQLQQLHMTLKNRENAARK